MRTVQRPIKLPVGHCRYRRPGAVKKKPRSITSARGFFGLPQWGGLDGGAGRL